MEKQDEIYFVNMYPIFQDGEMVGGLSVVTFLKDAYAFQTELEQYEKRNKQVLHRVNKANSARYTFDSIVAVGENVQAVKALAQKAAETDATVLLASESGTGKELYAQAIHNASARKNEVFVAINCANFNANTLESELFGYVEGAFTGAKKGGKIGLFEAANGGTLFLDEVSEMDYSLQAKLLRAIQEGRIRPVGGVQEIEVDVRLISASNADLNTYIQQGRFRRDLYYRLSTFQIHAPPLRDRRQDIPALPTWCCPSCPRSLNDPSPSPRRPDGASHFTIGRVMCGSCETSWSFPLTCPTMAPSSGILCPNTSSAPLWNSRRSLWPNGCGCLSERRSASCY